MIDINQNWPCIENPESSLSLEGELRIVEEFFNSSIILNDNDPSHKCNIPFLHLAGLSFELLFKIFLRGTGLEENEIRKYNHSIHEMYMNCRDHFNEVLFVNLVIQNTQHISPPEDIIQKIEESGEEKPESYWRFFPNHLGLLDELYDRPFRSRYVTPGDIFVPEPEILIIGGTILLQSMQSVLANTKK